MTDTPTRHSSIHTWLETRRPEWGQIAGMPVALRFQSVEAEQQAQQTLALCDLSFLSKLGIKGRNSQRWLEEQELDVPADIYASRRLPDGGYVVRLATDEFLLESGIANESVPRLAARLTSTAPHTYAVTRQEATFLLSGSGALQVLAQTCSFDFRGAAQQRLILTRVAGTSCGVFPDAEGETWACRLWVDCSYAAYLWENLVEITDSLGGSVVGAACVWPELR